jgi:hypothetical protein
MQCFKTYAATLIIADYLERMPECGRKLSQAAVADWMALNDIEPEDVLNTTPQAIKKWLRQLAPQKLPNLSNAA